MSRSVKPFFLLCILLTLGAVGHDIYIWQTSNGFPFAFAALGWISKTYIPDIQQQVVDMLGVDLFNAVLTPILKIPAAFFTAGLTMIIYVGGRIHRTITAAAARSSPKFKR